MATRSVICLPGILARSGEQHRPLWPERFSDNVLYEDVSPDQSFDDYIDQVVDRVEAEYTDGRKVVVLGSSFGGDISAFVHQRLQANHADIDDWLRLIIVDAPAGIRTFVAVPGWLSPYLVTSWFGTMIFSVIGWVTLLINRSTSMGLPKDEYITRPAPDVMQHMAGRSDFSEEKWRDWVKQTAKKYLSGHSVKLWRRQIQWMTTVFEDGPLEEAARSLTGHNVWYIQCTDGNAVVAQPEAQEWWTQFIPSERVKTVFAPHCGYLQMQHEFDLKIKSLMNL